MLVKKGHTIENVRGCRWQELYINSTGQKENSESSIITSILTWGKRLIVELVIKVRNVGEWAHRKKKYC